MIGLGQLLYKSFNEESQDIYFRKVEQADRDNFKPEQIGDSTIYRHRETSEISLVNPERPFTEKINLDLFEVAKTIFDGFLTGGAIFKAISLLGFTLVRVRYGGLIGSALGTIKAYVEYT